MLQWLVFFALFSAFTVIAGVNTYWQDIIAQPASAAAFLGALAGAGGGLLAIILGALLNAELNRRRDDRLRDEERRALLLALASEMTVIVVAANNRAEHLRNLEVGTVHGAMSYFNPPHATVFEANAARLGLISKAARHAVMKTRIISERIACTVEMYAQAPYDTKVD